MSPEMNFKNYYGKPLENETGSQLNSPGIASRGDPIGRSWSVDWEDGNDRVAPVHDVKGVEEVKSQVQMFDLTKVNITTERKVIGNKTRPNDDTNRRVAKRPHARMLESCKIEVIGNRLLAFWLPHEVGADVSRREATAKVSCHGSQRRTRLRNVGSSKIPITRDVGEDAFSQKAPLLAER